MYLVLHYAREQKFPASPLGRRITVRAIHESGLLELFRNWFVGFSIIDFFVGPAERADF